MEPGDRVKGRPLAIACAITAAAYAAKAVLVSATTPLILDTDDAMRLTEVHDFLSGQNWFDLIQHRLNTPYGGSIHWSRLVDLPEAIIVAAARLLAPANADVAAAYVWPLLLLVPLLWLSAHLALRLGGREAFWPGLILPGLSLVTMAEFAPGRFDHHAPQILLSLALAACLLAAMNRPRAAIGAGVAAAVALAIGIESLPIVVTVAAAFGLLWVIDARHAAALRNFGLSLAAATALGLAQGVAPAAWLSPMFDAISIVYAGAAVLCGAAFLLLSLLPLRSVLTRLAAGALAGAVVAGILVALWPGIVHGPYGILDPWLVSHWLDHISEAAPFLQSLRDDPVYAMAVAVPVLLALAASLRAITRRGPQWTDWLAMAGLLVVAAAVTALQIRGARLAGPLAVPMCAAAIGGLWRWQAGRRGVAPALLVIAASLASAGLAVGLLTALATLATDPADAGSAGRAGRQACLMPASFSRLGALPTARVMAPIDLGSHLLLYTEHSVVAAPYHRNQEALLDAFHFFNRPITEARAILDRRGIGMVVICPALKEMTGLDDRAPDSFVSLYAGNRLPAWLVEIPLGASPLRAYAVSPPTNR